MKHPLVPIACLKFRRDALLARILRRCGAYYHSADLFYQELWKQRLVNIGLRVLRVEKLKWHHVWDLRVCCNLTAQTYLLVSKPVPKRYLGTHDVLLKQFRSELQEIANELGAPIKRECITVVRHGAYLEASFIWPLGKPGLLLKTQKRPETFSFLISPWLKRSRN
jgi:hypothetical protein